MSRFARTHRVFFVEEPIPAESGDNCLRTSVCLSTGVVVVTPMLSPALSRAEQEALQATLLDRMMLDFGIVRPVLWFYSPMMMPLGRGLDAGLVVYDCMDELSLFKFAPPELLAREKELFERADVVFTGGHSLYEAKCSSHSNVHPFPSSVDVTHFASARSADVDPADQATIPHPRVGYCGVIDERLDLYLLEGIARLRPDWHFVMLGPVVKIDPATLPNLPNIHYLGGKCYDSLPGYLGGWDLAIMPFALNESTRFISPTKTPEYLAAGLGVVSTPVRDVVRTYGQGNYVSIARSAEEFVEAAESEFERDRDPDWRERVNALLSQNSWDKTWQKMNDEMRRAGSSKALKRTPGIRDFQFDYLIVGAGFAGATMAEQLARGFDKPVLLVDRRAHIAGNAYDHHNEHGILIHKYGPHIFHTNSKEVFDYLSRFTKWRPYEPRVVASVDRQLVPIPINLDTVNRLYNLRLESHELETFFESIAEKRPFIRTSEDVVVSRVGRELYEKMFLGYTRKQWGLDPSQLDASVAARIPVRTSRDDRYFTDAFQFMPLHGYTRMFENMLDHPNITLVLDTDYRDILHSVRFKELIYTGPVDEFFDFRYGKLPYRSLEFRHETIDLPVFQSAPVVNYPQEYDYTRVTEFKYLTGQQHTKTSVVYEYPRAEGDPYYPVPRQENAALYERYQELAEAVPAVHFAGRLGTYRYYNMDQVVAQSLTLCAKLFELKRDGDAGGTSAGRPNASPPDCLIAKIGVTGIPWRWPASKAILSGRPARSSTSRSHRRRP
jgi:UDP-galactopyranose mutase